MNEEFLRRSYERLLVVREHESANRDLCPTVDDIHALVKREGDEATRLHRLDHVMQCPECRKEFDLIRSVELSQPPAPASNWRLWAFAALLVLVLGASLVWRMMNVSPSREVLRGSTEQLTLITPAEQAELELPAMFAWRRVEGALGYRVELLDQAGGVTWSSEVADTTIRLENRPVGDVASWRVVAEFLSGLPLESSVRQVRLAPPR